MDVASRSSIVENGEIAFKSVQIRVLRLHSPYVSVPASSALVAEDEMHGKALCGFA